MTFSTAFEELQRLRTRKALRMQKIENEEVENNAEENKENVSSSLVGKGDETVQNSESSGINGVAEEPKKDTIDRSDSNVSGETVSDDGSDKAKGKLAQSASTSSLESPAFEPTVEWVS